tara:strand:+ start:4959 stop:6371 length:1413 start_codon:yes stop_codon:yes gene_type:complete
MELTRKQTKALDILEDDTTTELLFGGGAGGGKSAFGCYWQLKRRIQYPGTRGLIGRAKLKILKDTTLKTFHEVARMQKVIINEDYKVTSSHDKENPNCIVFENGSLIYLRDLFAYPSDPEFDDLGSLEVTDIFVDECNQITEKAKGIVKSRIRYRLSDWDRHGERTDTMEVLETNEAGIPIKWLNSKGEETEGLTTKFLGTCNPAKNWTYRQFYKPFMDGTIEPYRKFLQSLLDDNPFISKHYRANLLTLDRNSKERLLKGNWAYDSDPSTLIDADSIADYWGADHVPAEGRKYMTIDVARKGKDNTVFRVWHGWKCIHRFHIDKSGLDVVVAKAKQLQTTYGISLSHIIADEDGVGGGVVDFLGCKGFINGSRALDGENFTNLKSQCGYYMAQKIVAREVGEVLTNAVVTEQTSEEMEQVKQKDIDKDGKIALVSKDRVKEMIGRSPDEWDSIMMRYYFEMRTFGIEIR